MSTKFTKAFEMKNLMITAAVGALMLPILGWSAADGRGHNGPNLAPISIPIELDHGISAGKVEDALAVCFATGDSKSGVVSQLQRFADELTGGQSKRYEYGASFYEVQSTKSFYGKGKIAKVKDGVGVSDSPSISTIRFYPELDCRRTDMRCETITLQFPSGYPAVRYKSVVEDTGYDEYGRVAQSERILMGVSIDFDSSGYGTAVRLINPETHAKSAITFNTIEYVECLKNEIQKRAE